MWSGLLTYRRSWLALAAILVALAVAGTWVATGREASSVQAQWESTLQAVSKARAEQVEAWLRTQRNGLSDLADNPSLQMYFMALQEADQALAAEMPEREYLQNLLTATASKLGLEPPVNPMVRDETFRAEGGIALLDAQMQRVTSSMGMPALTPAVLYRIRTAPRGQALFLDIEHPGGAPWVGFVAPVYRVQADPAPQAQVGVLVSMIPPKNIAGFLAPEAGMPEVHVRLQRTREDGVDAAEASPSMLRSIPIALARTLEGTRWEMLSEVERSMAFAPFERHRRTALLAAALGALAATAVGMVVWSNLSRQRGVRLSTLNQLVSTLSSLADARDPHASEHSATVASISSALAQQMGLDSRMRDTTEMAAKLMNVGKANVSRELLTRSTSLEAHELFTIRNSVTASAELLEGIALEGPVAETLRQTQEYMDGTGPQGLRGQKILASARILAVVNAFVAMVSSRAYRAPMSVDHAIEVLRGDSGSRFDPAVVSALAAYVSRTGASGFSHLTRPASLAG